MGTVNSNSHNFIFGVSLLLIWQNIGEKRRLPATILRGHPHLATPREPLNYGSLLAPTAVERLNTVEIRQRVP